jgi:hypothetical protein
LHQRSSVLAVAFGSKGDKHHFFLGYVPFSSPFFKLKGTVKTEKSHVSYVSAHSASAFSWGEEGEQTEHIKRNTIPTTAHSAQFSAIWMFPRTRSKSCKNGNPL